MTLATIISSAIVVIVPVGFLIPEVDIRCGGNIGGIYLHRNSSIYVCDIPEKEFIKYHEIGHYYWFEFLTQKQKDEYTKLYEKSLLNGRFYREYSKTSVEESFADDFAIVALKINHNNTRLHFIRKILK